MSTASGFTDGIQPLQAISPVSTPTKHDPSPVSTVPFALSNLAHAVPSPGPKTLSPSVERALRKLELEEEESKARASSESSDQVERRVFVYPHDDAGHEPAGEQAPDEEGSVFDDQEHNDDGYIESYGPFDEADEAVHEGNVSRPVRILSEPRLTKAAALRLGIELPPRPNRSRGPSASTSIEDSMSSLSPRVMSPTSSTRSGHSVSAPKSLGAPAIVPRGTKASQLRVAGEGGHQSPALSKTDRRKSLSTAERAALCDTKHSRRQSIQVASTAPPKLVPRMNRGAMIRAGVTDVDNNPVARPEDHRQTFQIAERPKIEVKSIAPPSVAPRPTKASALRTGVPLETTTNARADHSKSPVPHMASTSRSVSERRHSVQVASIAKPKIEPRMSKAAMLRTGVDISQHNDLSPRGPANFGGVPGHRRRESIPVASVLPPAEPPRLNRTSALRMGADSGTPAAQVRPSTAMASVSPEKLNGRATETKRANRLSGILPRSNKSAELRSARQQEATAATGTGLTKGVSIHQGSSSSPRKQVFKRPGTSVGVLSNSAVVNGA